MAENESGEERSEEATSKKKSQAASKGQVLRSRELGAFLTLLVGAIGLTFFSTNIMSALSNVAVSNFSFNRTVALDRSYLYLNLIDAFYDIVFGLAPLFTSLLIAAICGNVLVGGWNFSTHGLMPDLKKLDPIAGIKRRMFSLNSLMELVKAIGKLLVVGSVGAVVIYWYFPEIKVLSNKEVRVAISSTLELLSLCYFMIVAPVFFIAAIDIPFQIYNHAKSLKMTKDEVKREMKDTEGKPEVKGRVRQLQREMANRRMMSAVPEADVVITNPTHYSVALKYTPGNEGAPVLLAKGADLIALKIREIAKHHEIQVIESALLTRAIYHTTELDDQIPEGLYRAVAQVLAYVFQLKAYHGGEGPKPTPLPEIVPPNDYIFD